MHHFLLITALLAFFEVRAQRMDPDQNPYWTRYTFVEDSSALVPLMGDYRVYYLQSGMWWSYTEHDHRIHGLPEKGIRTLPVFGPGLPAFQATPARGTELPDVKVVVVRASDTMVVELSSYYPGMGSVVNERCKTLDCARRPPVVLPFRPGYYLPNGHSCTNEAEKSADVLTTSLSRQFDKLWQKAMKDDRIIPQLNTDTCRDELVVPADLDRSETQMRDAWLMRSPYCGTHLVLFPSMDTVTDYTVTFVPYHPEQKKDPVHVHVPLGDHSDGLVDVSDWPVGDHQVDLTSSTNGGTFILKLR